LRHRQRLYRVDYDHKSSLKSLNRWSSMRRECVPSFSLQLEIFLNEESHGGATLSALWRRAKWSWIGGWVRRRRSRGRECSAMENEAYPFARSKWTTRFQWTPFLEREWLEEQKGCEVFLMAESLMAEWWRRSTMRKKPALQRALEALRESSWGYGCAFLDWVLGIRGTNCSGARGRSRGVRVFVP